MMDLSIGNIIMLRKKLMAFWVTAFRNVGLFLELTLTVKKFVFEFYERPLSLWNFHQ